jgi:hypothetical protein
MQILWLLHLIEKYFFFKLKNLNLMKNTFWRIQVGAICVVLSIFLFASCHRSQNVSNAKNIENQANNVDYAKAVPEAPAPPPPPPAADPEEKTAPPIAKMEVTDRKIIRTGDVRFKTSDLNQTRQAIVQAVQTLKGYVSEESQSGYNTTAEMRLTVRIPSQGFDSLMNVLNTYAIYFDTKNIHSQDVTEEFIDVVARIKTKKELETQYTTLLKKAQNIKEIMEVERELNNVRTEIESAEGRLRYLSNQTSFSTLNITIYKELMHKVGGGFWSRLGDSFAEGWYGLLDFFINLASLWSLFIVFGVAFWVIRRIWLARKAKN